MFALEIQKRLQRKRFETWQQAAIAAKKEAAKRKASVLIRRVSNSAP